LDLCLGWQHYGESHSAVSIRLREQRPSHLAHNLMRHGEAESRSVFFRGEEWIEEPVNVGGLHTVSMIYHANGNRAIPSGGR
jgi:hypothetical protein